MKDKKIIKETLENMYVVISPNGNVDYTTISYNKKYSLEYFLEGTSLSWKECYKNGYRCYKMTITFKPQNN